MLTHIRWFAPFASQTILPAFELLRGKGRYSPSDLDDQKSSKKSKTHAQDSGRECPMGLQKDCRRTEEARLLRRQSYLPGQDNRSRR